MVKNWTLQVRFSSSSSTSSPEKVVITRSVMICNCSREKTMAAPTPTTPFSGFLTHPQIYQTLSIRCEELGSLPSKIRSSHTMLTIFRHCRKFQNVVLEKDTKHWKCPTHADYAKKRLFICRSERHSLAMILWYNARLKIFKHERELQYQFLVVVVYRNPVISHPLRQNHLVEQRFPFGPTGQHGHWYTIKMFLILSVTTFSYFYFRASKWSPFSLL